MEGSPDDLPQGWTLELKSRLSGPKAGEKYKCYVAPTGLKFYSKRKVAEYLQIEYLRTTSRLNKRSLEMPTSSQAVVVWKEDKDEGLPPGWTKMIKCRKTGDKTRKDPYYTDPVTGYIFRSRKDVFRYLETGEIGRHAFKPKKGGVNDLDVDEKNSAPTAAKRQKVECNSTKRQLFTGQNPNSSEAVTDENIPEPSGSKEVIPVLKHASIQSAQSADLSIVISPGLVDSKEMPGRELRSSNRLVTALPAPESSSVKQKQQLKEREEESGKKKTSKTKEKKELSVPRRASKRLAGIKVDLELDLEIGKRKSHVETVLEAKPIEDEKTRNSLEIGRPKSQVATVLEANPVEEEKTRNCLEVGRLKSQVATVLEDNPVEEEKTKSSLEIGRPKSPFATALETNPVEEAHARNSLEIGWQKSEGATALEANPVEEEKTRSSLEIGRQKSEVAIALEANPFEEENTRNTVTEQVYQVGSALEPKSTATANESGEVPSGCENPLPQGGNTLVMKEQHEKSEACNLGSTETAIEKPESSLIPPFGDSWPDPCLEFAFKTLTGDNLVIEDYFQQQLGSLQTQNPSDLVLPDSSIDGFCQATDLFQFDALERPPPPSQLQKNPVLLAPGNGTMISFGRNDMLQQPSQKNPVLPAPGNGSMISFGGNEVLQQTSQNGTNSRQVKH